MNEIALLQAYLTRIYRLVKSLKIDFKPPKRNRKAEYEDLQNEYIYDLLSYVEDILWFSKTNLEKELNSKNSHNLIPNIRILLEIYFQTLFLRYENKKKVAQFFIDNKKLIFLLNFVNKTKISGYTPDQIEADIQKVYKKVIEEFDVEVDNTLDITDIKKYKDFGSRLFSPKKAINKFIGDPEKKLWITSVYVELSEYEHARPSARLYYTVLRQRVFYAYLISFSLWIIEELIKNDHINIQDSRKRIYENLYSDARKDNIMKKLESLGSPAF